MGTQNTVSLEAEREKLNAQLQELVKARRAYTNNLAALAMIDGRIKRIRDRLHDLAWEASRSR